MRTQETKDLVLVHQARVAADAILDRYLGVPIWKEAMDLGSARGFDRAVAQLAATLQQSAHASDLAAVRAAVSVLDVDWHATTAAQRRTLIDGGLKAAGRKLAGVPRTVQTAFGDAASAVVAATRSDVRARQALAIGADFNAIDQRIIRHLSSSQALYVRDEYGRRQDAFGRDAQRIVARGLEEGLGRDDIARDLEHAAQLQLAGRGPFYWDVVAGAFIGRGRSYAQLSAYAEAGIERYVIEAVLDERTTETCRFLHGTTFSVGGGLESFARAEAKPESLKYVNPWVRERRDEKGRQVLMAEHAPGRSHRIAIVDRPGLGTRDARGSYSMGMAGAQLQQIGVSFPPYHGLCRTTTVAAV